MSREELLHTLVPPSPPLRRFDEDDEFDRLSNQSAPRSTDNEDHLLTDDEQPPLPQPGTPGHHHQHEHHHHHQSCHHSKRNKLHRCKPCFNLRFLDSQGTEAAAPELHFKTRHHREVDAAQQQCCCHCDGEVEEDLLTSPKLSVNDSERILEEMKKCRLMMDFCEFQKFVLLTFAVSHHLLQDEEEEEEQQDEEFMNAASLSSPKSTFSGTSTLLACSTDPALLKLFKEELWVPDCLEEVVDGGDLDLLSESLEDSECTIGVYLINTTRNDFDQTREVNNGDSDRYGYYLGKKCDSWRVLEEKFGDNAFCILVADSTFRDFLELRHRLPSHCMPAYEKGHIVLWSRMDTSGKHSKQLHGEEEEDDEKSKLAEHELPHVAPRPKWELARRVEANLPYNWPEDISCSYRQWKRIVFSSQLQELIRISEERARRSILQLHRRNTHDVVAPPPAVPKPASTLRPSKSAPALHYLIHLSAERFHEDLNDQARLSEIYKHLDDSCHIM
eukprot:TRINITY_DN4209_c0_g1_i2.p1 TRINITY_DN4209_c0_g1~~TRINITY_DN4209_c0_g1_i2.p1  ORF type:complete len:502 (+),score=119.21 TRINITY_DN4209_c0_g1_i2:301-1806(+)